MGGLIQPSSTGEPQDSNWTAIAIGIAIVVAVIVVIALLSRGQPKVVSEPHPYASSLKITDLKMSAAQNFVGASVTYLDGTVANSGDKTVIHAMVHVVFRNSLAEIAQAEDVPVHVLQTTGPYPDSVDLMTTPLAPGQSKRFRLTFEHITTDWNQQYPELQVTDVTVK